MTHKGHFQPFPQKVRFSSSISDNFVLENCILISNMAMKYAIFHEFIEKVILSACLKSGEKQNCAHAEALCSRLLQVTSVY